MKELLQKFILNECTEAEIKEVVAYFQKANTSNELPSVEEVMQLLQDIPEIEEETKTRIYQKVLAAAEKQGVKKRKRFIWQYAAAAIFIGFLCIGYFYQQGFFGNGVDETIRPEQEFITLELEDGRTKIISEDGTVQVTDKSGKIIGKQEGNRLVYDNAAAPEKLTYNTLRVPYGKRFELQLSDGTRVHLNAGTSLKYPVKFLNGMERKVFLVGEAYFDVSEDTAHPFIINADDLNVKVLGTQFNVSSYPEDAESHVVLVEGSVDLYAQNEALGHTVLEPGFKGSFNKAELNIATERVVTSIYTSWINGGLVFRNMPFNNILKKLERHYDVSITNNNEDLAYEKFNASFTEVPIEKILEYLKITYAISFTIDGKNITIE
ncbi:FecR family protein [Seonamhaeicola sp.]|uniref:FecR family protein n=1 Tax=Seonamhaeicola sp. TaxID=1912245 RepID=UPI00261B8066|nr:FecR family protein [Seonamhaeicola sp.]